MSLLRSALGALAAANHVALGASVIYRRRSGESATLTVTLGRTEREQSADRGFTSKVGTDDVLVTASDFRAAFGDEAVPEDGDQIERDGRLWAARPTGGEPCWRWSDAYGVRMRIHVEDEGQAP